VETGKARQGQGTAAVANHAVRALRPCQFPLLAAGRLGDRRGLVVASILDSWSILTVRGSRATWTSRRKHRVFATRDVAGITLLISCRTRYGMTGLQFK
jgi:hypothetical protein